MTEYSVIFHNFIFASLQRPANKLLVCYFPSNNNQEKMNCRITDCKVAVQEENFFSVHSNHFRIKERTNQYNDLVKKII